MKCIVTSFGSAGDCFPTIAMASALKRRGHEVRMVANPACEALAAAAGLELIPAGTRLDIYEGFERDPAYGESGNLEKLLRDFAVPNAVATYRVVVELLRNETADLVVANEAGVGAFMAAWETQIPCVLVNASPLVWMSWHAPLIPGDRRLPTFLSRPLTVVVRALLHRLGTRVMRTVAREVGTPLAQVSFAAMQKAVSVQLGLWSPLLRGPLQGDPTKGSICGFTRSSYLGVAQPELSAEVDAFLSSGPAPVVVGLGSVFALSSPAVLTSIAEACALKGLRCLIVGHPSGMTFPGNTMAVRYAPYDRVFSRAAAVVVHAGAGTTGEALRAGKPIIAVPFAFDQFALAAAMEDLDVCVRVPLAARTRSDFVRALDRALSDKGMRTRAAEIGQRFSAERDGAESGADVIERFMATHAGSDGETPRSPSSFSTVAVRGAVATDPQMSDGDREGKRIVDFAEWPPTGSDSPSRA